MAEGWILLDRAARWVWPLLVNLLGMSSVFVLCIWLILKVGRIRTAVVQHALWRVALLGLWLSPLLAWMGAELDFPTLGALVRIHARSAAVPSSALGEGGPEAGPAREAGRTVGGAVREAAGPPLFEPKIPGEPGTGEPPPSQATNWRDRMRDYGPALLLGLWGLGLVGMGGRWGQYRWRLRAWRRTTQEIDDPGLEGLVQRVLERLGLRQSVVIRQSPDGSVPVVFGARRPCLLLPTAWIGGRDPWALEAALLHELAHVGRGDLWINAWVQAAQCVFWFHPLIYLIGWQLSRTAEEACDDWVIAATGQRARYANLLVDLTEQRMTRPVGVFGGLPFVREGSNLKRRVKIILDEKRTLITGLSRRGKWGLGLVTLLACMVAVSTRVLGGAETPLEVKEPQERKDEKFAGETAWQVDEKLGKKWQEITGRFIFQRTCRSCHPQGPASFTKTEWKKKLKDFPDEEHVALLPKEFEDLTAMFSYGRMVADDPARYQSLETFLLKHAPAKKVVGPEKDLKDAVDLLPAVGQEAPDFSIMDTEGRKHTLKSYIHQKEALILVFSRAHW